jgi:[protein-PII] uridylyltransferase
MTASPIPIDPQERIARQRARLAQLRQKALDRYNSGAPGLQVAALISEMSDALIVALFEEVLSQQPEKIQAQFRSSTAIVAVGGSGRGELCPYSDADLLFLQRSDAPKSYADCVAQVVRDCWDAGIKLGHSTRTVSNAISHAAEDPQFATSLVEARLLWGAPRVLENLTTRFATWVRRRRASFFRACVKARDTERQQFGNVAQQLEPDIKRGTGGLRDIHLIRWTGFAWYGTSDLDLLRMEGALSREDFQALQEAHEYLTRIRVELHFAGGRAQEVLSRGEQIRLAHLYGLEDTSGQRGVERFMQGYFRHATTVASIASRFVARHTPVSLPKRLERLVLSHRRDHCFLVSRDEIDVLPSERAAVCSRLERVTQLFELAGLNSVSVHPQMLEMITSTAPKLFGEVSAETAQRFLSILGQTGQVGRILRLMFTTGVLDKIIPEVSHVRCLMQFNQYHSFTVDEHTLRAVEAAESYEKDTGPLGVACRSIRHRELLHLSLLLHDLGKGYEEDHCEVGKRIAETVGHRLRLPPRSRETVAFLVQKHLLMTNFAFRRDLSDRAGIAAFSREIGSPELLKLLYVHTAADMTAVGPGVWTDWKAGLIAELYDGVMNFLSGEERGSKTLERIRRSVDNVKDRWLRSLGTDLTNSTAVEQIESRLAQFPEHYFATTHPDQVLEDLAVLERVALEEVLVTGKFDGETRTVEYRVYCRDTVGSGIFSRVTGALTAQRLGILTADICTTADGYVVDALRVTDDDFAGEIPPERIAQIATIVKSVLRGEATVETLLARGRRFDAMSTKHLIREQTRVVIDNELSKECTVIDVFAHDCPGLLYRIAATLLALNLSVARAKIATHVDQVVDVFYVTDTHGEKIRNEDRLSTIQTVLCHRIEELESQVQRAAMAQARPSAVPTHSQIEQLPAPTHLPTQVPAHTPLAASPDHVPGAALSPEP